MPCGVAFLFMPHISCQWIGVEGSCFFFLTHSCTLEDGLQLLGLSHQDLPSAVGASDPWDSPLQARTHKLFRRPLQGFPKRPSSSCPRAYLHGPLAFAQTADGASQDCFLCWGSQLILGDPWSPSKSGKLSLYLHTKYLSPNSRFRISVWKLTIQRRLWAV